MAVVEFVSLSCGVLGICDYKPNRDVVVCNSARFGYYVDWFRRQGFIEKSNAHFTKEKHYLLP